MPPVIASDIRVPVEIIPSGILVKPETTPSPASVKKPSYLGFLFLFLKPADGAGVTLRLASSSPIYL